MTKLQCWEGEISHSLSRVSIPLRDLPIRWNPERPTVVRHPSVENLFRGKASRRRQATEASATRSLSAAGRAPPSGEGVWARTLDRSGDLIGSL